MLLIVSPIYCVSLKDLHIKIKSLRTECGVVFALLLLLIRLEVSDFNKPLTMSIKLWRTNNPAPFVL